MDDVQEFLDDVKSPKEVYYYAIGTCIVSSLIYCFLIRYCSKPIIWLSIIGIGVGLVMLTITLRKYHIEKYSDKADNTIG